MPIGSIMLAASIAAPAPTAPYPRPGEPGYSVAKAFVAIVRRDEEVNVQDLSYAFGLPKLLDEGFIWHGLFGGYDEPGLSASYDPPKSSLGITKIVIEWDSSLLVHTISKIGVFSTLDRTFAA